MGTNLELENGSRVAIIGGGPSGSFFAYFLLEFARWVELDLHVDIYEPRDFSQPAPLGCNMCGGIISESLVQHLGAEGIMVPPGVVQRGIDSYFLHTDRGSVRIPTPLREARIAAVHRSRGPRGVQDPPYRSFDGFLLDLATQQGAHRVRKRVDGISFENGRPQLKSQNESSTYDLITVAVGINSPILKMFEPALNYKVPVGKKAYICEYLLGAQLIDRYLGNSMHVFLLPLPGLEFAALIPKGEYVTVCVLGDEVDSALVKAFLSSREVKQCFPPGWQPPSDYCHCSPKLNVQSQAMPFSDRVLFIGDCGVTRLYKDGIGAAYRTSKAAASTAVFDGISANDFRQHYWPACRIIASDNRLGKLVFAVTRQIAKRGYARAGMYRMVCKEQGGDASGTPRMSQVLWDTFTGSAPYRTVLLRSLHPAFWGRLLWEIIRNLRPRQPRQRRGREL